MPLKLYNLDAFSIGFFQDILQLMTHIGEDTIIRQDIELFIQHKGRQPKPIVKNGGKPCKGCGDKKRKAPSSIRGGNREKHINAKQRRRKR